MIELTVLPCGPGWRGVCSSHGALNTVWFDPTLAAFDCVGHGAAHHPPRSSRAEDR